MVTKAIRGEGVKVYNVEAITPREFEQLCEMRSRVYEVLESHKTDKKMYLTDDELFFIEAVLQVLTGPYTVSEVSEFDRMKKDLKDVYKKNNPDEVKEWDDEAIAEQTSPY